MRTTITYVALGLLCLVSWGCSNSSSTSPQSPMQSRYTRGQNNTTNSDAKSVFDTGDEPAVTAQTHFAAGQLSETQGNLKNAVDQYQQALKLDPNHLGSLYRLGVIYAELKEYQQAVDAWKKYVEATHGSAQAYNNLGFCYDLSGDGPSAETAYRKGIAADPRNVSCRVDYGLMLARQGHITDAIVQWQAVLKPAEIYYNLGSVYEMQGRREEARQQYHEALKLDPTLHEARERLAALDQ
ncbi:MAG TPA: tetratricopeptide repeat protein [Tepidisphaeraceae bacterium]|nr:tetratricopeptide repeat protein [Tepidisphaeraceae bacterium]